MVLLKLMKMYGENLETGTTPSGRKIGDRSNDTFLWETISCLSVLFRLVSLGYGSSFFLCERKGNRTIFPEPQVY